MAQNYQPPKWMVFHGFPTKHEMFSVGHWYHNFEPNPDKHLCNHVQIMKVRMILRFTTSIKQDATRVVHSDIHRNPTSSH